MVNEAESCIDHIYRNNLSNGMKRYVRLHDISDNYSTYLTVSKARKNEMLIKKHLETRAMLVSLLLSKICT